MASRRPTCPVWLRGCVGGRLPADMTHTHKQGRRACYSPAAPVPIITGLVDVVRLASTSVLGAKRTVRTCESKFEVKTMVDSVAVRAVATKAPAQAQQVSGRRASLCRGLLRPGLCPRRHRSVVRLSHPARRGRRHDRGLGRRGRRILHRHVDRSLVEPIDRHRLLQGQGLPHRRRHRLHRLPDGPVRGEQRRQHHVVHRGQRLRFQGGQRACGWKTCGFRSRW